MQRERFELSNLPGLQHGSDIGVHVLCSENKKGRPWQRLVLYDNSKFHRKINSIPYFINNIFYLFYRFLKILMRRNLLDLPCTQLALYGWHLFPSILAQETRLRYDVMMCIFNW